jgi:hypothetical protein
MVLNQPESAFYRAVENGDYNLMAAMAAAGIFPSGGNLDMKDPFQAVLDSSRTAPIRFFLGMEGFAPDEDLSLSSGHVYWDVISVLPEEDRAGRAEISSFNSEYSEDWYRKLLSDPLQASQEGEMPAWGWGCSNTMYFLGTGGGNLAFLSAVWISNMPGYSYRVNIYSTEQGEYTDSLPLGDSCFLFDNYPDDYDGDETEQFIQYLMEKEDEWISFLDQYDITPRNDPLPLRSLPYGTSRGSFSFSISEEELSMEEYGIPASIFAVRLLIDGEVSEDHEPVLYEGIHVYPLGIYPVMNGDTVESLVAVFQVTSYGFEMETDNYLTLKTYQLDNR